MTGFLGTDGAAAGPGGEYPDAPEPPPVRQWGYAEILLLGVVAVLSQVAVGSAALAAAQRVAGLDATGAMDLLRTEPRFAVPVQLSMWLAPVGFIAYVVAIRCGAPVRTGFGWHPMPRMAISYVRMGALLAVGSMAASIFLGGEGLDGPSPMTELLARRDSLWVLAAYGILIAPCLEEGVFRGFLFAPLERYHGPIVALAATSVVFALLHGAQYGWQWQRLVVLVAIGSAFGAIRMRAGSAKASAVAHAAYNALLFVAVYSFVGA